MEKAKSTERSPVLEHIQKFDRSLIWTIIGVLITLFSLAIAIYFATWYEKRISIKFDIISDANVLELHEQIGKLSILYDNENISEKNLNLKMITLRIENDGQMDILQYAYDNTESWGFCIDEGRIIETNILDSNSDYLRTKLNPIVHLPDSVLFEKTIFEREKFITLKVLILHNMNKKITVIPLGKIAGIDKIPIARSFQLKDRPGFWSQLTGGTFLVHLVRVFAYGIAFLLLLVMIISLGEVFRDQWRMSRSKMESKLRTTMITKYKASIPFEEDLDKVIFKAYADSNAEALLRLSMIMKDPDKLKRYVYQCGMQDLDILDPENPIFTAIKSLIDMKKIIFEQDIPIPDQRIISRINNFLEFVEANK